MEADDINNEFKEQQAGELPIRKRKRDNTANEIEVDLNAPEPPSKKAKRKNKKGKSAASKEAIPPEAPSRHRISATDPESSPSPALSDFEEQASTNVAQASPETYGIWIGNLPFTCTSSSLRTYITKTAPTITDETIIRVRMPAPALSPSHKGAKAHNKGFAYIDFATADAQQAAIQLSESQMGGRNLLIKSSDDFHGRPSPPANGTASKTSIASAGTNGLAKGGGAHPPSKRVFVGNLGYAMTKEDLQKNFESCGEILDIHTATFEDTGRSKGYAWVTFATIEAAMAAVRGWCKVHVETDDNIRDDGNDEASKKTKKSQKWFVNRIYGRQIRCEFAEDPAVRYKKRFGRAARETTGREDEIEALGRDEGKEEGTSRDEGMEPADVAFDSGGSNTASKSSASQYHASHRPQKDRKKVDARKIPPGAALARAQRGKASITMGQGTKTVFE